MISEIFSSYKLSKHSYQPLRIHLFISYDQTYSVYQIFPQQNTKTHFLKLSIQPGVEMTHLCLHQEETRLAENDIINIRWSSKWLITRSKDFITAFVTLLLTEPQEFEKQCHRDNGLVSQNHAKMKIVDNTLASPDYQTKIPKTFIFEISHSDIWGLNMNRPV